MFSWILYMFCASSYLISKYACSNMCFSCTDLRESETCQHVIRCADNEICFTQKYRNSTNQTLYSLGCTYPELCGKDSLGALFGRRSTVHSHVLCHKCCDSSFCNMELNCIDDSKATRMSCLSCGGVDSPASCQDKTTCGDDEVCYIHKYKTRSNHSVYDLGCKHASACHNKHHMFFSGFGKRTDTDIHLTCEACCSEFSLCNHNLNCSHTNQKKINESCLSSSECLSNLVCTWGKCVCPTADHMWNNYTCLIRKTISEKCLTSDECMETLYCNHGVCKCDRLDYWTGQNCTAKKTYNEACLNNMDCQATEQCVHNKCICHQSYWNGHICRNTKPLECADLDFTTDGLYLIYPDGTHSVEVNCVIREGIKWTVFQRRLDGSVDFRRTWNEYKTGFGNSSGEFWLGNDIIHLISSNGHHQLRVEMTKKGKNYYAVYSQFLVESEFNNYRLNVTGYHGNAGDSLNNDSDKLNGMDFTTTDRDNDRWGGNCATSYGSGLGWWYNVCGVAYLNRHPGQWYYDLGYGFFIESSQMMLTRMST